MPDDPTAAALSPEAYLRELAQALRPPRRSRRSADGPDPIAVLRASCDEWTIGTVSIEDPDGGAVIGPPVDPCSPLLEQNGFPIAWPSITWSGIAWSLLVALEHRVEDPDDPVMRSGHAPALAGYVACVHLELCAREETESGPAGDAVILALLVAARKGVDPVPLRRYLLGWLDRTPDEPPGDPAGRPRYVRGLVGLVTLAVALGSDRDRRLGARVRACRDRLDRSAGTGRGRFRDFVDGRRRPRWREVAAAAPADAADWAAGFMR